MRSHRAAFRASPATERKGRLPDITEPPSEPAQPQSVKEGFLTTLPSVLDATRFSSVWGWARGPLSGKGRRDIIYSTGDIGRG